MVSNQEMLKILHLYGKACGASMPHALRFRAWLQKNLKRDWKKSRKGNMYFVETVNWNYNEVTHYTIAIHYTNIL